MIPLLVLKLNPAGTVVPSVMAQVRGWVPPVTPMVWLYGTPTPAEGKGKMEVKNGNGFTLICSGADLDGSDTDVAITVADCTVVVFDRGGAA